MRTQQLFGLGFESEATIDEVAAALLDGGPGVVDGWRFVVTPNVDHVVRYAHDARELALAERAAVVLPDGMPIVWASRLLGRPLARRLTGADLFVVLWQRVCDEGRSVVVLASDAEVAELLRAEHPAADISVAPAFDRSDPAQLDAAAADIAARVERGDADIVVLGIGAPSADAVAAALARRPTGRRPGPAVLLVGASAEFHVGLQRRAPVWMRRAGLEWSYRLLREPRRLAHRYLVEDVAFVRLVWREWRSIRRGGPA